MRRGSYLGKPLARGANVSRLALLWVELSRCAAEGREGRYRGHIRVVATRPGEGRLTQRMPAVQPRLTEREFLVTAFGDLVGRPPEMRAVAIVAQDPAHGPTLDVAIDAVLRP